MIIHHPSVAGQFYPSDKNKLRLELDSYFQKTKKIIKEPVKILIVPHAGLFFSGGTTAWGYKQVEGQDIKRIILLGVSHRVNFSYAAVSEAEYWESPFGNLKVDSVLKKKFVDNSHVLIQETIHEKEHTLEMQTIFLAQQYPKSTILPILISQSDDNVKKYLAHTISESLDDQTVLVVSTDLSHYPAYDTAIEVDKMTITAIISGDPETFNETVRTIEHTYSGVDTAACGQEAIVIALRVAKKMGISFQLINYTNSGDISWDRDRVVGYAALEGV
jgi:MEMO1 family protein